MIARSQLADQIIRMIELELDGVAAHLRGSLAAGTVDDFSDIDIGLRCSNRTDKELSVEIIALVRERYDIVFHDWARSLLPGKCIVSVFIAGLAVHWQVDIEINVPDSKRVVGPEDIPYDHTDHFLKLWIGVSEHAARAEVDHEDEVASFYWRVLGKPCESGWTCPRTLSEILHHVNRKASGTYPEFFRGCKESMRIVEQMHAQGRCTARTIDHR